MHTRQASLTPRRLHRQASRRSHPPGNATSAPSLPPFFAKPPFARRSVHTVSAYGLHHVVPFVALFRAKLPARITMLVARRFAQAAPFFFLLVVASKEHLCASQVSSPETSSQHQFYFTSRPSSAALNLTNYPYLDSCLPAGRSLGLRSLFVWQTLYHTLASTVTSKS